MARIKKNLKAPAIKAIRKMIAFVLANPKSYDQNHFPAADDCGAPYCAAGHLIAVVKPRRYRELITKVKTQNVYWHVEAAKVLGLSSVGHDGFAGFGSVFGSVSSWPAKFAMMYYRAKGPKGRARAFANRWENFIATDGAGIKYAK